MVEAKDECERGVELVPVHDIAAGLDGPRDHVADGKQREEGEEGELDASGKAPARRVQKDGRTGRPAAGDFPGGSGKIAGGRISGGHEVGQS